MEFLADHPFDLALRGRAVFGIDAIDQLPAVIANIRDPAPNRAFVVTDPGVVAAGVIERVQAVLSAAGITSVVYHDVEPNPGIASVKRGSAAYASFGNQRAVIVAVGGGSVMDTAKVVSLHALNGGDVGALGYHREDLFPGTSIVAVPTTAGTGAETNTYGVITDEAAGRKTYIGHPSVRPVATILDPRLTVRLPPAATAATGVDAMTHAIESYLSRRPNPLAASLAIGAIGTIAAWLPRAVAIGMDLEARSHLLVASHLAGLGQASGTGVGLVHALGHAIGTRGRLAHGTALATVLPEVLAFYADQPGLRDAELHQVGVALRAASPTEEPATGAIAAIGALRGFLADLGQRPTLRSLGFDEPALDVLAQDAIDDAAIANSPRLPTFDEARAILGSVLG